MNIILGSYTFEGPFKNIRSSDSNRSGVYAILGKQGPNSYKVIDIGESAEIGGRISNHDRAGCWSEQSNDLYYACYSANENDRFDIEQELREIYNPPCGEM